MLRPSSGLKSRALLAICFMVLSCMTYSLTLKMQAMCSSETSVDFQQTTLCYMPFLLKEKKLNTESASVK
jgi:hypothetical protein